MAAINSAGITVGSPVAQALVKTGTSNQGIARHARHQHLPLRISHDTRIHDFIRAVPQRWEARIVDDFTPANAARHAGDVVAGRPRAAGDPDIGQVVDQRSAYRGVGLMNIATLGQGAAAALVKRLAGRGIGID